MSVQVVEEVGEEGGGVDVAFDELQRRREAVDELLDNDTPVKVEVVDVSLYGGVIYNSLLQKTGTVFLSSEPHSIDVDEFLRELEDEEVGENRIMMRDCSSEYKTYHTNGIYSSPGGIVTVTVVVNGVECEVPVTDFQSWGDAVEMYRRTKSEVGNGVLAVAEDGSIRVLRFEKGRLVFSFLQLLSLSVAITGLLAAPLPASVIWFFIGIVCFGAASIDWEYSGVGFDICEVSEGTLNEEAKVSDDVIDPEPRYESVVVDVGNDGTVEVQWNDEEVTWRSEGSGGIPDEVPVTMFENVDPTGRETVVIERRVADDEAEWVSTCGEWVLKGSV